MLNEGVLNIASNYGLVGLFVVFFIYDYFSNKRNNRDVAKQISDFNALIVEQMQSIINSNQKEQAEDLKDIETILGTLKESLFNHNQRSQNSIESIKAVLGKIMDYRVEVKDFLDRQHDKLDHYYDDYKNNLILLNTQVVRLREIITNLIGTNEVLDQLIDDGIITRSQANDAIAKVAQKNIESEKI